MNDQPKKLYRSRADKVIAGVCAGLGKYLEIDPIIVRLIFIVLFFFHGAGIFIYLVLLLIMPKEPGPEPVPAEIQSSCQSAAQGADRPAKNFLALVLILLGTILLLNQIYPLKWLRWDFFWPGVIIALGIYLLFKNKVKK